MKNHWKWMACGAALTALGAGAGHARAQAGTGGVRTLYFWSAIGGAITSRAAGWGNGKAVASKTMDYEGHDTLEVTTHSFGEGARFDLKPTVPIAPYRDTGYLRLRVRFGTGTAGGPGGGGRGGGGRGGGGGPFSRSGNLMLPLSGEPLAGDTPDTDGTAQLQAQAQVTPGGGLPALPGIPGVGGGNFGRGGGRGGGGRSNQSTTITNIQMTLVLDQGVLTSYVPVDLTKDRPDNNGWYLYTVPVNTMRATPNAAGNVQRLIITSDGDETFYLAQASLVIETGQMSVTIRRAADAMGTQVGQLTVAPGPLSLIADVEAGAADPDVSWNFDADNAGLPRADGAVVGTPGVDGTVPVLGPRVDARGLTATFTYPNEEQDYRVEVTVRDRSGKKAPLTTSLLVKVRGN